MTQPLPRLMPHQMSAPEVLAVAQKAGFRGNDLILAVAIARAESNFDPDAIGDEHLMNDKWGPSVGLWQIRSLKIESGTKKTRDDLALRDPLFNARSAYQISGGGRNFKPWSVYTSGAYKKHISEAADAFGAAPSFDWQDKAATVPPPVAAASSVAAASKAGPPIPLKIVGRFAEGALGEVMFEGSIDLTTEEVSEVSVKLLDPDFELTKRHKAGLDSTFECLGLRFRVVQYETGWHEAGNYVGLKGHPAGVVGMRIGVPAAVSNVSPTDYMKGVAQQAGLRFVGEPSAKQSSIGPLTIPDQDAGGDRQESAWEVGRRLADVLGYHAFESAGTYYFGSGYYLMNLGRRIDLTTANEPPQGWISLIQPPKCSATVARAIPVHLQKFRTDLFYCDVSVDGQVDPVAGMQLRPGAKVFLHGTGPVFDKASHLLTKVTWNLVSDSPVEFTAGTLPAKVGTGLTDADRAASSTQPTATAEPFTGTRGARISQGDRERLFGPHGDAGRYGTYRTPWGLTVRVHPLVRDRFIAACNDAKASSKWAPKRMDSYANRAIRGSNSWSLHSWALAWDLFDTAVPSDVWSAKHAPDAAFREAFKRHGFYLGADFGGRKDYPHIEWAAAPP